MRLIAVFNPARAEARFVAERKTLLEAFVKTLLDALENLRECGRGSVRESFREDLNEYVLEDTGPLHSRACWNDAAGSVGAQRTRPAMMMMMDDDTSLVKVVASTTDVADVGMRNGRC